MDSVIGNNDDSDDNLLDYLVLLSTGGSLVCSAHGVPRPTITWVDGSEQAVGTVPGLR